MVTARERNCYIAISECVERYSLDDVLFAIQEQIRLEAANSDSGSLERLTCNNVEAELYDIRERMLDVVGHAKR